MSRSQWLTRVGAALLATVTIAGPATPAMAASTGVASVTSSTKVQYKAGSAKTNSVVVTRSGRTITIDDRVRVKAGKGCKPVKGDKTKVRCKTRKNPSEVRVTLGDRNDALVNRTAIPVRVYGGTGNDRLTGGSGVDRLHGDGGADTIRGERGNDLLYGGSGNDSLNGGTGHDGLDGGTGNDTLDGGFGSDLFLGGGGIDRVDYRSRTAPITADVDDEAGDDGQAGERDTITTGIRIIAGGAGDDVLTGGAADDTLEGGGGNDKLKGSGGIDTVKGGAGNDILDGTGGDDVLLGDDGADKLYGGDGRDRLDGGAGNDWFDGDFYAEAERWYVMHGFADTFIGGAGRDAVSYASRLSGVTVDADGATGDDGAPGEGDSVGADIEDLDGTRYSDQLTGNNANNRISGGGEGDTMYGLGGDDELYGSSTADIFYGGENGTEAGDYCDYDPAYDLAYDCER
ncbi:calcium-binding protein [Actinoplanes sp. GCM10030250]|uniref:calcium-binding protein n=1 Tax=Actinoplanes sp. GCM10030250 TaxID=3273376 RepID=UPI00360F2666